MAEYYSRWFEVQYGPNRAPFIEATSGRQLRVVFKVLLDWNAHQSYLDLSIFNLSRESESKVFRKDQDIALLGGYESRFDYLFQGQITNFLPERFGADRIARVYAKGGAVTLRNSTISKTLGEGATLPEVIKACADAMGLPLIIHGIELDTVFSGGYSLFGDPKKHLAELSKTHGFDWVIENNKLVVVGRKSTRPGPIHEISALTGMEGSPEVTENGADVQMRLNPKIKIGQLFRVNSEYPRANFSNAYYQDIPKTIGEGTYKVQRIEHSGDSYGDTWTTKLTGLKQ